MSCANGFTNYESASIHTSKTRSSEADGRLLLRHHEARRKRNSYYAGMCYTAANTELFPFQYTHLLIWRNPTLWGIRRRIFLVLSRSSIKTLNLLRLNPTKSEDRRDSYHVRDELAPLGVILVLNGPAY